MNQSKPSLIPFDLDQLESSPFICNDSIKPLSVQLIQNQPSKTEIHIDIAQVDPSSVVINILNNKCIIQGKHQLTLHMEKSEFPLKLAGDFEQKIDFSTIGHINQFYSQINQTTLIVYVLH